MTPVSGVASLRREPITTGCSSWSRRTQPPSTRAVDPPHISHSTCRGKTDLDEGEVVFVGGRAAHLFQKGKRGIGAGCSGPSAVQEMVGEFLQGQHGTIGPDDFIGAVAENKEAIEVVQGDPAVGIGAVRERADGRAWSLERLDVGAGLVGAREEDGRGVPGAGGGEAGSGR